MTKVAAGKERVKHKFYLLITHEQVNFIMTMIKIIHMLNFDINIPNIGHDEIMLYSSRRVL